MKTVVITTAGMGTRLATISKSLPKTMLPIYVKSKKNNEKLFKPLLEIIFENLFDFGFRKFCIIINPKFKNIIQSHFNSNPELINLLKTRNHFHDKQFIKTNQSFESKISKSEIIWISQPTPMGFGDALLSAKNIVKEKNFLLHAGDTYFSNYNFLKNLIDPILKYPSTDGSLLLENKKILHGYGIAETKKINNQNVVMRVEEKPQKPKSNLVILPIYGFKSTIFDALEKTKTGFNKELQITDAIQTMISNNQKIVYHKMKYRWFDIGSPERYKKAIDYSFKKKS